METATLFEPIRIDEATTAFPSFLPVPGFGLVPVNTWLIRAEQPILIDTGLQDLRDDFIVALRSVIDPAELDWIWLTHTDPDHVGAIEQLLELAPGARVVTTFVGLAKMSLFRPLPVDRVYLLNPGEELDLGDRKLIARRPPTWDAPETTGFFDTRSRIFFSSDSFGALLQAPAFDGAELSDARYEEGLGIWTSLDAPWLSLADPMRFGTSLGEVRGLDPSAILSTHAPPAVGMTDKLLGWMDRARERPPFVGPNQEAFRMMFGPPATPSQEAAAPL